jgi:hypothetical protein
LAICHCGAGSEAGGGACYIKFGAVAPGPDAALQFERLLDACESLAAESGLQRLEGGVNAGRRDAWRRMQARGFRPDFIGVAMHRGHRAGYNRPDVYAIDDWR